MEIQNGNKPVSRKKFVAWTAAIFSGLAALQLFVHPSRSKKISTVKMLTQEGKLVEVEVSRLSSKRKKIKDEDVHSWIQRKPSL
jgi:hypothetical protein